MERCKEIANYQSPHALFTNVHNALPEWIQHKFANHRADAIRLQNASLTPESRPDETLQAGVYKVESMQHFFVRNYRPTCKRRNVFRSLYSIKMQYSENPRVVVDRIPTAVNHAK